MKPQSFTPRAFMLITYLFIYLNLTATEFIRQGFDSGTVAPSGWLIKAAGTYTSVSGSGTAIPSLKFGNNGDMVETPEFSGASECSFMIKGYSIDSLSSLNIFYYDGFSWSRIDSIHHITSSKKIIIRPISISAKKLRFIYHKSKGNIAFDDLIVKNNKIVEDSTPPVFLKEPKYTYSSDTSALFSLSINKPGKVYFIITSENCIAPEKQQLINTSSYDSTCLIKSGNYTLLLNTDTIVKIKGLRSGTKYTAYWLTGSYEKTAGQKDFYSVNFSFPKTNSDLFFSEIDKGTSYNKAIEVFNPLPDTVYLKNYRIAISTNGAGWKTTYYKFPAGSKIAPNDVFVTLKSNADTNIVHFSVADDLSSSSLLGFTGNDAMGLQVTNDNGLTWRFIDIFGNPDSSIVFDIAGIKGAAGKSTLVRKKYITHGNLNWLACAGTNEKNSEWIVLNQNDFTNLGIHQMIQDTSLFFENIALENQEMLPVIDSIDHVINFILHSESDIKNLQLTAKLAEDISINPDPLLTKDFSKPVKFTLSNIGQTIITEWSINATIDDAPNISSLSLDTTGMGKIKIVLTEPVNYLDLVNKPFIKLFETSSKTETGISFGFEQDNKVIVISFDNSLKKGVNYTLLIDSVIDNYNNLMPAFEWTFNMAGTNSILNVKEDLLQVFPNPSKDFITLKLPENYFKGLIVVKIISLEGKVISSAKFDYNDTPIVNISDIKNGTYLLVVSDHSKIEKHYFIKCK